MLIVGLDIWIVLFVLVLAVIGGVWAWRFLSAQ
jgi:hypothetical protein